MIAASPASATVYISAGAGDDRINGGEGNDHLFAGTPGQPRILGITNYLFGHTGTDTAYLESDTDVTDSIEQIR